MLSSWRTEAKELEGDNNLVGNVVYNHAYRIGNLIREFGVPNARKARIYMASFVSLGKIMLGKFWKLYTGQIIYPDHREFPGRYSTAFLTIGFDIMGLAWFLDCLIDKGFLNRPLSSSENLILIVGSIFLANQIVALGRAAYDGIKEGMSLSEEIQSESLEEEN